jgi:hypothetical protein
MPLAYQAVLPFAILLLAAALTKLPSLRAWTGQLASAACALSGLVVLFLLLELRPTERLDVAYLRTFPGADLAVRLDGLSLAFAVVMLTTAAGLMLARLQSRADRRDPWRGWLLTSAAALLVILAGNLLLVYIALQVLTLAWSGAIDETAPRARWLRLAHQAGDVALLVAAAAAIRSSGTSAFAGMPSDTIGPLVFLLLLVPVATRVAGAVLAPLPPAGTVAFLPAVAWLAPGGALLFRIFSLTAGRPLDRPVQVAVFAAAVVATVGLALVAASAKTWPRFAIALVAAQAAVALALGVLQNPLATVGAAWVGLQLVPLAGLVSIQPGDGSLARSLATLSLGLLPPSAAFLGIWLAIAAGRWSLAAGLVLALVAVLTILAIGRQLSLPRPGFRWPADAWASIFLLVILLPEPLTRGLVLPVARTIRSMPAGAVRVDWFGLEAASAYWPVTLVGIAAMVIAAALVRLRPVAIPIPGVHFTLPRLPASARMRPWAVSRLPWRVLSWIVYGVVLAITVQR